MEAYFQEVRKLEDEFEGLELHNILRKDNQAADNLTKLVSSRGLIPNGVFVNNLHEPSIRLEQADKGTPVDAPEDKMQEPTMPLAGDDSRPTATEVVLTTGEVEPGEPDWRIPFLNYLLRDTLPPLDNTEARRLSQ
ncbi:uncharacterized protein [Setaria viridis]|uniref:uncharacterized protein n=1 Tax=Setaria viridis TaxID=4556 RepID=UPI001493883C|nr:uncharacterized protein LOC117835656 [Setaria viridis]